jgi:type IV pilus assembly protein PilM
MAQVVGVDIGTSAVRAVEVALGGAKPVVVCFGQVPLPPGSMVDGEVVDEEAVAGALRHLWRIAGISSTDVVLGVGGLRTIVRELVLPWVSDDEVDSAVRLQAEEVVPFPPDRTVVSARATGESATEDGGRSRRVMVAACHRELLDRAVGALEKAGLDARRVDLLATATLRAVVGSEAASERPEAVVSVGAGFTVVVVHQGGVPRFVRSVPVGGSQVTAAIAAALDLPVSDAERLKRRLEDSAAKPFAFDRAIEGVVDDLVREVRRSIEYATSVLGGEPVAQVVLTGGGSRLVGLLDRLSSDLHVPVRPGSALDRVDVSRLELGPEQAWATDPLMAAALGLVLPPAAGGVAPFDLLPGDVRARRTVRRATRKVTVGAVAAALVVLGVGGLRTYQVHRASAQVGVLRSEIVHLDAEKPRYSKAQELEDDLAAAQGRVESLTKGVPDWYTVLEGLASQNPAGLAVTNFSGTAAQTAGTAPSGQSTQASSGQTGTQPTTPGEIGSFQATVTGTFQGDVSCDPYARFIGQVGKPFFGFPVSSGPTCPSTGGQTVVTFPVQVPVLEKASLEANGCYDPERPQPGCPGASSTAGTGTVSRGKQG